MVALHGLVDRPGRLPLGDVPDDDGGVVATGREPLAVVPEGEAPDEALVPGPGRLGEEGRLRGREVDQRDRPVEAAGREKRRPRAVGVGLVEGQAAHGGTPTGALGMGQGQTADLPARERVDVPDSDLAIEVVAVLGLLTRPAAGDQGAAVPAERQPEHPLGGRARLVVASVRLAEGSRTVRAGDVPEADDPGGLVRFL